MQDISMEESKPNSDNNEKNIMWMRFWKAGEDYLPRGEEVFTETFRHME